MVYTKEMDFNKLIKSFNGETKMGLKKNYNDAVLLNLPTKIRKDGFVNNVLYITGIPGSGKSELAKDLSSHFQIPIFDLDAMDEGTFISNDKLLMKFLYDTSDEESIERESIQFLKWLSKNAPEYPIIVEGRQIYESKVPALSESVIVLNPDIELTVHNRMRRDSVNLALATKSAYREKDKLNSKYGPYIN